MLQFAAVAHAVDALPSHVSVFDHPFTAPPPLTLTTPPFVVGDILVIVSVSGPTTLIYTPPPEGTVLKVNPGNDRFVVTEYS